MPPLLIYAIPVFLLSVGAEWAWSRRARDGRHRSLDSLTNLVMGSGNLITNFIWKGMHLGVLGLLFALTPLRVPMDVVWGWALLFILDDLCYYWFHRASHRSRLFWASHVVHHSSESYNLSTALRQTWTGGLTGWVFWAPLALLGFHPAAILTQQAINLLYQYWIHTEYIGRLGPFEWLFNTPSHHRVHHGRDDLYLDRNYAGTLIIWDRIFGTFEAEAARPTYGITKPLRSYNPLVIALHEWRAMFQELVQARGVRAHLRALLGPPR